MTPGRHLRGSTGKCPKCGCSKVNVAEIPDAPASYGPVLAVCLNCRTLWEPFDPDQVWDPSSPTASFREPCDNCAFRPGSHEQVDREKWRALIADLKAGGSFHCHKGVPIEANSEHGFAYPSDRRKLRLCRGYLNAVVSLQARAAGAP